MNLEFIFPHESDCWGRLILKCQLRVLLGSQFSQFKDENKRQNSTSVYLESTYSQNIIICGSITPNMQLRLSSSLLLGISICLGLWFQLKFKLFMLSSTSSMIKDLRFWHVHMQWSSLSEQTHTVLCVETVCPFILVAPSELKVHLFLWVSAHHP